MSVDLFEAQVQVEVERRVKEELQRKAQDPEVILRTANQLLAENRMLRPKAEKYDEFLNKDGFLDVAQVADAVKVEYIAPDDKVRRMGRNHLIKVLLHDQVIVRSVNGFHIHSRVRDQLHDRAVVKVTSKNDRITSSVLFNAEGLDWLSDRYSTDRRVWRSTSGHEVYCE